MTPLAEMIPAMSDSDLISLRANAERLLGVGSAVQASAAADILPLIDAEVVRRSALPTAPKKRVAPVRKKVVPVTGHQTALPKRTAA